MTKNIEKIMNHGIAYMIQWSGWGSEWETWVYYLTQEQYNALTEAEKTDPDKNYFIYSEWDINPVDDQSVQLDELPVASATEVGAIHQYTGETTGGLTNGYFYKCVSDGQDPATYSWEPISVQQGGGSGTANIIYLTQDEYDALSASQKADATKYYTIYWEGLAPTPGATVAKTFDWVAPSWSWDFIWQVAVSTYEQSGLYPRQELYIRWWTSWRLVWVSYNSRQTFEKDIIVNGDEQIDFYADWYLKYDINITNAWAVRIQLWNGIQIMQDWVWQQSWIIFVPAWMRIFTKKRNNPAPTGTAVLKFESIW